MILFKRNKIGDKVSTDKIGKSSGMRMQNTVEKATCLGAIEYATKKNPAVEQQPMHWRRPSS
ncbi:hypothetical protein [Sphingobacterium sp. HMA12]|uniref:hypothetical protein n=1 Tax=Sphingobacterium sp. HMA12 TaxID=2050894 RepID=UPI000CEA31D6|nr:hypothetical protein [Sphingobacterium sp. HMA12]